MGVGHSDLHKTLLRLALAAAERGDAASAAEALRAALALPEKDAAVDATGGAVSRKAFAKRIGVTPEHVSHLIKRGRIPADAVLGEGRGLRILPDVALEALKLRRSSAVRGVAPTDDLEAAGAAYERQRAPRRGANLDGGASDRAKEGR